ncbi:MAG: S24 family peptidase [Acidobacteriota bacterium]
MKEIDEVIEQHGGWPGAFQTDGAKAATADVVPFRPRTVHPKPEERYLTCVPLVPLKAAAGAFSDPQQVEDDDWEWVAVDTKRRLRPGMFVAQVVGKSMEPVIPDGAWCLFAFPVTGTRQGKTVLVKLHKDADPESGANYTVKRYQSEKVEIDGVLVHSKITLKPINPDYKPIVFTEPPEGHFAVIAELLEVLGEPPSEVAEAEPAPVDQRAHRAAGRDSRQQSSFLDPAEADPSERNSQGLKQQVDPEQLDRDELVCMIRQLFSDGEIRDRDSAIRELARDLGYERAGSRIHEILDNALRTAVRRGVIANAGDGLALDGRRIEDYKRDFLKDQFLASLEGRAWKEREDAIRDFARWLGFLRTGPVIDDTSRSIINGLIREGRLESNGSSIRRCG